MDRETRRGRTRSFLLGGVLGASAVAATVRRRARRRRVKRRPPAGLSAFESAPCYQEALEQERATAARRGAPGGRSAG
jgi:hypothetical protein